MTEPPGRAPSPVQRRLRGARPSDHPFIEALSGEAFAPYGGDYRRIIREWLEAVGVEATVAEAGGRPEGFSILGFLVDAAASGAVVADLLAIAVVAGARRSGIGRALLARAVARGLALEGVTALVLSVAEENRSARRLFEGGGFRYEGEEGLYPGGQRALRMRLDLSGARRTPLL